MEHAVFNATVIASRSEQDAAGINPGELKQPDGAAWGGCVASGPDRATCTGADPRTEQVARMADPDTGEIHGYRDELERRGQQRLEV